MRSSIRQFCIAISCLMATISMIVPASDGLFYCFPMQRIMIEDCCGEDEEHHQQATLTHPQCCEKLDMLDVDVPVSVDAPNVAPTHWLVKWRSPLSLSPVKTVHFVYRDTPRARGPPERGPPAPNAPLFIQHQSLLI